MTDMRSALVTLTAPCVNHLKRLTHTLLSMVEYKNGVTFLPQMAINAGILQGKPWAMPPQLCLPRNRLNLATHWAIRDFRLFSEFVGNYIAEQCRIKNHDRTRKAPHFVLFCFRKKTSAAHNFFIIDYD